MKVLHVPTNRIFTTIKPVFPKTVRLQRTEMLDGKKVSQTIDITVETFQDQILKGIWITA